MLDAFQTIPPLVYAIPFVTIFDVGIVPGGIIASVIYAVPPGIRVTALGVQSVPGSTVEAATTFGASPRQLLWGVRVPLALPAIMLAVNQVILMVVAMVIIAGLTGGGALGYLIVDTFTRVEIGRGVEVALALTLMAMVLDRLTQGLAERLQPPRRRTEPGPSPSSREVPCRTAIWGRFVSGPDTKLPQMPTVAPGWWIAACVPESAASQGAQEVEVSEASRALPEQARCVVIGAGIVGNCLVGHLARLGWTDLVQVDKGPLPNPGGSTGHASNFIFPTDHNKEMALLTLESQRQYVAMDMNSTCGGIEVARTPERMEEFNRRMTSATAWGIDARLLTPAEVKELVPFRRRQRGARRLLHAERLGGRLARQRDPDARGGGRQGRPAGVRHHGGARHRSRAAGDRPAVRAVVTDKGRIECEHVAIACGVWSPRLAAMAGATIPFDSGGPPDGRRRSDRHPRADEQGGRLPDRPRHGHVLLRAAVGGIDGGRVVRPPTDLPPPRRHPLQRGVSTQSDRASVHRR